MIATKVTLVVFLIFIYIPTYGGGIAVGVVIASTMEFTSIALTLAEYCLSLEGGILAKLSRGLLWHTYELYCPRIWYGSKAVRSYDCYLEYNWLAKTALP